ncbi:MAG: cell division protein [Bdellovibrionales bacterium]|nr:cell division protein [Bdellovibrionales bacterium]
MKSRILILFSAFLLLWAVLLLRAARLQIFPDERLASLKRRQFETSLQIHTRRGAIVDRNGTELAASVPAYSLFADPKVIRDPYGLGKKLGSYLDMPAMNLKRRLRDKQRRFIWIKRQLSEKQRDEIKSWGETGLGFVEEPKRVYPNGGLLSQVLGFVGSEGNGLEGLELEYNKELLGQMKTIILPRDARGRPLLEDGRSLTEVPDGADLQLTIDHEVQFTLERELAGVVDHFQADTAIGIVMDAQSSEIVAMATLPVVDLNESHRYPQSLRRNRVVTDAFEPGSTMKSFVIAGALKENLIKPSTRFFCEDGRMKVGDKWITEADSNHHFKTLTVTEILAFSSNIGAAKIGFELGAERLNRVMADFGFGAKTGVELPGEARGIMNPLPWRPHLLSNISFGQGIATTPMQMVAAYGAIANGGLLKRPLLVKAVRPAHRDEEVIEFQAEEIRRVLSPSEAATMRLMLTAATEEKASGWNARIPGYHVAGKTGTAQKVDTVKGGYIKNAYISSFAGFVPASNPRYVIYVAVDNPKKAYYGSQVAAPVFSKIAQYLVRRAGIPPVLISERNMINTPAGEEKRRSALQARAMEDLKRSSEEDAKTFPNLMGLSLREALAKIRERANHVQVRGSGVVVRTIPMAGSEMSGKRNVVLVLENPD